MSRGVLFCVFLFLGSASAFGSWYKPRKNVKTECGYFHTLREGWLWDDSMTDIDTAEELEILKSFDVDKDGYLTAVERYQSMLEFFQKTASFDLQAGVQRCDFVEFISRERDVNKIVTSYLFDLMDIDKNDRLTADDINMNTTAFFKSFDANSDGRVSICEYFQGVMRSVAVAENKAHSIQERYENIVNRSHKKFNIFRWMHGLISSWGW